VAARAPQEILSVEQALAFVERHGVVAESAQHPHVPSLAAAVAGSPIRGNWWTHPRAKTIFAITRGVRESSDVLVCRIVEGKIGFVHQRLWPALVRVAQHFPAENIARLRESHTANGRHRVEETPFPAWVPQDVDANAKHMRESDALEAFASLLNAAR
jgi:hypothetical protein